MKSHVCVQCFSSPRTLRQHYTLPPPASISFMWFYDFIFFGIDSIFQPVLCAQKTQSALAIERFDFMMDLRKIYSTSFVNRKNDVTKLNFLSGIISFVAEMEMRNNIRGSHRSDVTSFYGGRYFFSRKRSYSSKIDRNRNRYASECEMSERIGSSSMLRKTSISGMVSDGHIDVRLTFHCGSVISVVVTNFASLNVLLHELKWNAGAAS